LNCISIVKQNADNIFIHSKAVMGFLVKCSLDAKAKSNNCCPVVPRGSRPSPWSIPCGPRRRPR